MWISVLEDEAVLNNLITKYLQKEGYSVRSYLRGEDAVQGLDKPTDLWVIDIMLPDIDGFTVFREVQRKNPNSYAIFISARNQDIDRLAGLELARRGGARCVLTCVHPLEAEELEKLRAALCRLHHKKEIVFDVRTDPALLGGFTLDIEGVRYDKSVRGALGRMGRQLEERRMA